MSGLLTVLVLLQHTGSVAVLSAVLVADWSAGQSLLSFVLQLVGSSVGQVMLSLGSGAAMTRSFAGICGRPSSSRCAGPAVS